MKLMFDMALCLLVLPNKEVGAARESWQVVCGGEGGSPACAKQDSTDSKREQLLWAEN